MGTYTDVPMPATVYLAGPMRGYDQFNFPKFDEVLSPAEHDRENGFDPTLNSLEGFDMKAAFRWDIESVLKVDAVVLLPGWEKSTGASLEKQVADACGVPCFEYVEKGGTFNLKRTGEAHEEHETPVNLEVPVKEQPETPLEEAQRLVGGDRGGAYGHPLDDMTRTAAMWSAILGVEVTAEQVAMCMICVKLSRERNKHARDNRTDIAGYTLCLEMILEEREHRQQRQGI